MWCLQVRSPYSHSLRALCACAISVCCCVPAAFAKPRAAHNQQSRTAEPHNSQSLKLPAAVVPACPSLKYTRVTPPDVIAALMNKRKRYRLVIGAGEFGADPKMDRDFVDPTARLIDARLAQLGYLPLPTLSAKPYLIGKDATKTAIMAAVQEMARVTSSQDLGVIYYVGHGSIPPSHADLELAVYDRPVSPDSGIRVSDLLGTLETSTVWRANIKEIPHFLLILDTCFSGNAALGTTTVLDTVGNSLQTLQTIVYQQVPSQIVIMSATAPGANNSAYELGTTGVSAFGYFFARALKEDWACADTDPDGILTFAELIDYIRDRLRLAYTNHELVAPMVPKSLNGVDEDFIAYDPTKHYVDGLRRDILEVSFRPDPGQVADITLPSGYQLSCSAPSSCQVAISKSYANGVITISSSPTLQLAGQTLGALTGIAFRNDMNQLAYSVSTSTNDTDLQRAQLEAIRNLSKPPFDQADPSTVKKLKKALKSVFHTGKNSQGRLNLKVETEEGTFQTRSAKLGEIIRVKKAKLAGVAITVR